MKSQDKTKKLFDTLVKKATLKQVVYQNTLNSFKLIKSGMENLATRYEKINSKASKKIPFTFRDRSEFEAELKFAGDTLVLMMHTNIFELPRDHEVMKTPYINEDKDRSYCGIIQYLQFFK